MLVFAMVAGLLLVPGEAFSRSCSPKHVKRMLRSFPKAYNAGNLERLDALFMKGEGFRSYDVHPVERPDGSDRSTLMNYFEERHSFDDAITVTRIQAGRYDNGNRGFGFGLEATRSSEELSPFADGDFAVKGSATCSGIYFWNMTWNGP